MFPKYNQTGKQFVTFYLKSTRIHCVKVHLNAKKTSICKKIIRALLKVKLSIGKENYSALLTQPLEDDQVSDHNFLLAKIEL